MVLLQAVSPPAVTQVTAGGNTIRFSGLIQARLETITGSNVPFLDPINGGTVLRPQWGGVQVGGSRTGFMIRNGNLRIDTDTGTSQTVTFQFDANSYGPPTIRDAFINIHPPTTRAQVTVGQFIPQFGYELRSSGRVRETDERAMAFSDSAMSSLVFRSNNSGIGGVVTPGSVVPFFNGQDRDQGLQVQYNIYKQPKNTQLATLSVINGEGRDANGMQNQNGMLDVVSRYEKSSIRGNRKDAIGTSVYYGHMMMHASAPFANSAPKFVNAARRIIGIDIRQSWSSGREIRFEAMNGIFEASPDRALYVPRNHVSGYYAVIRQPISSRKSLFLKYDVYNPGTPPGCTFSDKRQMLTGGLIQRLQPNALLRCVWIQGLTPFDPAATNNYRARVGTLNVELQVEF